MGLKVLLADESTSIKKAFQLALADYAVEVKSVPSGLDVLTVSLDFMPDIIFADVLLTKKSGYEVCKEVKAHPKLTHTPFILMWSHFMEFDTALATKSGFTDKIEKPFDTNTLRAKINTYVAKTKNHPLQGMVEFPPMPNFIESESAIHKKVDHLKQKSHGTTTEPHVINENTVVPTTDSIDLIDDFEPVQLRTQKAFEPIISQQNENTSVDNFKIQIETENYGDFEEVLLVKSEQNENMQTKINEQIQTYLESSPITLNKTHHQQSHSTISSRVSSFDEQMMREEVRTMAEKICWQVIPDVAERIVREEISKLLSQIDKSI